MKTKTEWTASDLSKFRNQGFNASQSLRAAKTLARWKDYENIGLVKMEAIEEEENYFDVYGEPEGYTDVHGKRHSAEDERKEIERQLNLHGCWIVRAMYRDSFDDAWQSADSVGMCAGYKNPLSPFENAYVTDLMQSAIDAVQNSAIAPNL
jgi:hypothetical protein